MENLARTRRDRTRSYVNMNTRISERVFEMYTDFEFNGKAVSANEAKAILENCRSKGLADFHIARQLKVVIDGQPTVILSLPAKY